MRTLLLCVALVAGCASTAPSPSDASNDAPIDASDAASDVRVSCPPIASPCPDGCTGAEILKLDPTRNCLLPTGQYVCAGPPPWPKCFGLPACRVAADGSLYKFASVCMLPDYGFCAGAEDTKVLSAPMCD